MLNSIPNNSNQNIENKYDAINEGEIPLKYDFDLNSVTDILPSNVINS